jgi:hypothetical protein
MRIFFTHKSTILRRRRPAAFLPKLSDPALLIYFLITVSLPVTHSFSVKMSSSADLRTELLDLIGKNPGGHLDATLRSTFADKLKAYAASDGADPSDVLFAIGSSVYGVSVPPPAKKANTSNGGSAAAAEEEADPILDFDYMKKFMYEVFISYGVTPERAEICSDVLIESDKRGIDSHGLGRLKPIYVSEIAIWPHDDWNCFLLLLRNARSFRCMLTCFLRHDF